MTVVSVLRLAARCGADVPTAFAELEIFEHSRRSGGFRGGASCVRSRGMASS